MNFDDFWKENDIWKYDPYISESDNIEEKAARYGWEECKQEILKQIGNPSEYCCSYVEEIVEKIKEL